MDNKAITIVKAADGLANVSVLSRPQAEEIHTSIQSLVHEEVRAIAVAMPAALATEFMLVQTLSFLRREGKSISIQWTDHAPSVSAQQIIQSLIL